MIKLGAVINFSLLSFLSFCAGSISGISSADCWGWLTFPEAILSTLLSHCGALSAKLELLTPLSTDTRIPLHPLFLILCLDHFQWLRSRVLQSLSRWRTESTVMIQHASYYRSFLWPVLKLIKSPVLPHSSLPRVSSSVHITVWLNTVLNTIFKMLIH